MAGHGWRMLVECLSVGRAISLPSSATGAVRGAVASVGAYARMRKQFGLADRPLRRRGRSARTHRWPDLRHRRACRATAAAVDRGEKPAVPSAIAKYHATEWGRAVAANTMDVLGGKGVQLGPKNYAGRAFQGVPIAITVEGANIMTRSLMIFGQGAIRCHPYVLKEMQTLSITDRSEQLKTFDRLLFSHLGFGVSNAVRSFATGPHRLAHGRECRRQLHPSLLSQARSLLRRAGAVCRRVHGRARRQAEVQGKAVRASRRRAELSVHRQRMLKRYEDTGRPEADRPLLAWAFHECVWRMQMALDGAIRNFPVRPVSWLLRVLVFPFGRREVPPSDRLGRRVAALITGPAKRAIACWMGVPHADGEQRGGPHERAAAGSDSAEPVDRKFAKAQKSGQFKAHDYLEQLAEAEQAGVIKRYRSRSAQARTRERVRVHLGRRLRSGRIARVQDPCRSAGRSAGRCMGSQARGAYGRERRRLTSARRYKSGWHKKTAGS
jgi:acyl-CoA dehydrogenase